MKETAALRAEVFPAVLELRRLRALPACAQHRHPAAVQFLVFLTCCRRRFPISARPAAARGPPDRDLPTGPLPAVGRLGHPAGGPPRRSSGPAPPTTPPPRMNRVGRRLLTRSTVGRDSNPRRGQAPCRFQDRAFQPLSHPTGARSLACPSTSPRRRDRLVFSRRPGAFAERRRSVRMRPLEYRSMILRQSVHPGLVACAAATAGLPVEALGTARGLGGGRLQLLAMPSTGRPPKRRG